MDDWPVPRKKLTRREALAILGKGALASSLLSVSCVRPKKAPVAVPIPPPLSDDQFLDQMEHDAVMFFWERTNPVTGQVMDRAYAKGTSDPRVVASIAATGFGLTSLCIAVKRGYLTNSDVETRVLNTLSFIWSQLPHQNGFFYHFVDMNTGKRVKESEVSSIDTAILMCGVLTCRQFLRIPRSRAWRHRSTSE